MADLGVLTTIQSSASRKALGAAVWQNVAGLASLSGLFGIVTGTVFIGGVPAGPGHIVRCYHRATGNLVAWTRTDASGNYQFIDLDTALLYTIIVHDEAGTYNAVVRDNVTPDPNATTLAGAAVAGATASGTITTFPSYWANVSALMHFDGTNGSTVFYDEKSLTAWNYAGTPSISTAQSVFGGASCYFDGASSYLIGPTSAGYNFGTADFTVEGWAYQTVATSAKQGFFTTQNQSAGTPYGFALFGFSTTPRIGVLYGWNSHGYYTPVNSFPAGQFNHVVLQRKAGVIEIYINGAKQTLTTVGSGITADISFTNQSPVFGRTFVDASLEYLTGYLDEWRITKGVARYSADFEPPSKAFPNF